MKLIRYRLAGGPLDGEKITLPKMPLKHRWVFPYVWCGLQATYVVSCKDRMDYVLPQKEAA